MTARNLQDQVKKQGLPWSAAKGFDTFTPIGWVVVPGVEKETFVLIRRAGLSFPRTLYPSRII